MYRGAGREDALCIYIALDIFKKKQHNEGDRIHDRLEAWLTFFCRDEPEMIFRLLEEYPEFRALYEDVYELCRNVEGLMEIFSKELLEMDRNTVKLMIDQMQEKIDAQEQAIQQKDAALEQKDAALKQKDAEFEAAKQQMQCQAESFEQRIAELERKLAER